MKEYEVGQTFGKRLEPEFLVYEIEGDTFHTIGRFEDRDTAFLVAFLLRRHDARQMERAS